MSLRSTLALMAGSIFWMGACSGGEATKEPSKTSVGEGMDAAVTGGKGGSGGTSNSGGKMGTDQDASDSMMNGDEDAGIDPLDPFAWTTCTPSDATVTKVEVPFTDESAQALVTANVGFGIAYRVDMGCDEIHGAAVPAFGAIPSATPMLGQESCLSYRDLSMLYTDDGWLLAWIDNSTGSGEVHAQYFDDQLAPSTGQLQITDNSDLELRPLLSSLGGTPLLSYIVETTAGRSVYTKRLDTSDDPIAVVAEDDGHLPTRFAVAQMGLTGAVLAWVNENAPSGVYLQPLAQTGDSVGSSIKLSDFSGAGATVDLATNTRGADTERGGAIVYSVSIGGANPKVRFHRLTEDGKLLADERTIIDAPLLAQGASIANVGDGYVIAYRALPDGNIIKEPQIRMLFATREGNIGRDEAGRPISYEVAKATAVEGRVTVRMSVEGQLLLSWLDVEASTGQMVLKYSRRPLNCP